MLTAQDNLASIQAQKSATTEQLASAKRNFEVGTQTITDTHEAQAAYDLVVAQEFAAINALEEADQHLTAALIAADFDPAELERIEERAREQGLKTLFVLTTRTAHWFRERGFEPSSVDRLPAARASLYNYQRNSKIFEKTL